MSSGPAVCGPGTRARASMSPQRTQPAGKTGSLRSQASIAGGGASAADTASGIASL